MCTSTSCIKAFVQSIHGVTFVGRPQSNRRGFFGRGPGSDLKGDMADLAKDENAHRIAVGTLYVAANPATFMSLEPEVGIGPI